jgi:hypothetical protein
MPQPNVKEQIVAGPLQNVSIAFRNEEYIADRVFPILDGADPKAKITVYQKADWFRDEAGIRTAGTWCDGNVGGEDAEGLWSPAGATNTFLADITKAKKAIRANTGKRPNVLVLDEATYLALKENEALLDKIKHTQRGVFTSELMAALLELEEVLIGTAIKNIAKETKAGGEFTARNIWEVNNGKGMGFLCYRPKKLGLKVATAGIQVRLAYEDGQPRRVTTWREPAEHQDVYEVAEETDIVLVHAALGYLFKDTYAT